MSRARDLATFVSNADGDIRFDTDTLFVDSSANKVGIRTNTPPHPLSVFGTGAGNATVQIEGESGADPTINFLANNAQHWAMGIDDSDSDTFKISEHSALGTNDYLNIDVNGNVGVGISAPSSMLHLFDGGTDTGITLQSKVQANATSSITFMSRDSSNVNQNVVLKNIDGRLQSSAGIMFGSDTAAANALDDYEEGSWTVNVTKGGSALPVNSRYGYYTRIGDLLWASFYWYHNGGLSTETNNSTEYRIEGWPFTLLHLANSAYQALPAGYLYINNSNVFNATPHRWQCNAGTYLSLYGSNYNTTHSSGTLEFAGAGFLKLNT